MRTHAARFSLGSQVIPIKRMAIRNVVDNELTLNVRCEFSLSWIGTVSNGRVETTLAFLSDVLQIVVIIATSVHRISHRACVRCGHHSKVTANLCNHRALSCVGSNIDRKA